MTTHVQQIGPNKTGILDHPERTREMLEALREFPPSSEGSDENLAAIRTEYAQQAEPVGSLPPPLAENPSDELLVMIDKMGARLAFERNGVRLYDALIAKYEAYGSFMGGPTRAELENIRDDEYEHFSLLRQAIRENGGDPTSVTPSADLELVVGHGVAQAITDPRTNLLQCLEAILVAELADHENWHTLIDFAVNSGADDLAQLFRSALIQEEQHLASIRRWIAAAQQRVVSSAH